MPAPPINTIYIPTIPPPTPAPSPGPPSPPFFLDSAPASPPHTPSSTASSLPSPSSPGSGVGAGVSGLGFDLSGVDLASLPPEVLSLLASAPHNPSNPAGSNPNANANGTLYNGSSTTTLPSSSTPPIRRTLLTALLSTCTPAELLFISTLIAPRLKRDFLSTLPAELSLHILSFIDDPKTLGRAGRVCRRWGVLCQEEGVWRGMCGRWGYGVPRAVGRGRGEGKEEGGRDGEGKGGEEGEGGGCGYGERRREEPLEEMEAYANFPMDPALEWLITKRREELAPEGKGKGKGRDLREREPGYADEETRGSSYKEHFRRCYVTMTNWRQGGTLLRSHRIPPSISSPSHLPAPVPSLSSQHPSHPQPLNTPLHPPPLNHPQPQPQLQRAAPEGPVTVTSLALNADWVVLGLASSQVQVYSARTGVLAKTLVGHELGVWSVGVVGKGGWMDARGEGGVESKDTEERGGKEGESESGSREGSGEREDGGKEGSREERRRRRRSSEAAEASTNSRRAPERRTSEGSARTGERRERRDGERRERRSAGRNGTGTGMGGGGTERRGSLEHLVPASLRVAIGLDRVGCESGSSSDSTEGSGSGGGGKEASGSGSGGGKEGGRGKEARRKYSDMTNSSAGWGQPGSIVVSGGCDKVVMVWDVQTGHCIYRLSGHTSTIRCLRTVPHRPLAVSGSRDTTLRVWNLLRGRCERVLRGHTGSVRCVSDVVGGRVVSGSYDATCRGERERERGIGILIGKDVWDIDTGECVRVLEGHFHQVYSVAFLGGVVASGGLDTTVRVWDVETGHCIALLQGHTALVCQLQLSPSLLITGGSDGRVITFSLKTLSVRHRIAAHDCSVTSLQFVGGFGEGEDWDGEGGRIRDAAEESERDEDVDDEDEEEDEDGEEGGEGRMGRKDRFIVTGGNDGRVRLYEVGSGRYVRDVGEGGETVWRVVVGWGVCVVVLRRAGRTVVEVWSMRG
ncbi:hypothetical protein D9611_006001 [Ephemerocybe angulata]|uniref:F-box domain-containing protein n=1 Tax=Ephemerocybe angulata TaxID=980116 RepID=A0A8H5CHY4_9AGAR|nr:hypothetical protein D9611_006001 [Tulosesus angulatus]